MSGVGHVTGQFLNTHGFNKHWAVSLTDRQRPNRIALTDRFSNDAVQIAV